MTWRPPAMTYEGGPRICGYCAGDMHEQCDGSAWCEATQAGADCPCGHPYHRDHPRADPDIPPDIKAAMEQYAYTSFLPLGCECVIMFAGTGHAERMPHPDCPIPAQDHHDHRRQDPE